VHRALAQIEAAFADAPRPSNDDLLHEQCMDDNDIVQLYPLEHWRDMPDELVDETLKDFTVSKFATLSEDQRAAVIAFLEAVRDLGDEYVAGHAENALGWWRERA
jgi:hypothetical protein